MSQAKRGPVIGTIDVVERALRHGPLLAALGVWFVLGAALGPVPGTFVALIGGLCFARDTMWVLVKRYGWIVAAAFASWYVWAWTCSVFGVLLGTAGVLATIGVTAWLNWPWIKGHWRVLRAWWEWRQACHACGLYRPATGTHRERPAPRLRGAADSPTGLKLVVSLGHGWTVANMESAAPGLASWYRAREVRVSVDSADSSRCTVLIVGMDPLARMAATPWPNVDAIGLSLWDAIPVALDANGHTMRIRLPEKNLLLSGVPGAGKSAAQAMLIATAALDPNTTVYALDGKSGVDLQMWEPVCAGYAGPEHAPALAVLEAARQWMADAFVRLAADGKRKVAPGDPLALVCIDELPHYLAGTKKEREAFTVVLRDLVSRGRAAGVIVVACTQRPASDVIPTSFRDLMGFRWALRCTTPQASDMALGQGWAARGYDASTIPEGQQGTGLLLHEESVPALCRSYFVSDDELERLARRAAEQRGRVAAHAIPRHDVRPGSLGDSTGEGNVGNGDSEPERSSQASGEPVSPLLPASGAGSASGVAGGRSASVGSREPVAASGEPRRKGWGPLIETELRERPGNDSEIARRLGCDRTTVAYHRRRLGL